ncbi:MAG: hypothetical protein AB7F50_10910 [Fimbriimonadaceae bacterium]
MSATLLATLAWVVSQDTLALEDAMVLGKEIGLVIGGARQVVPESLAREGQFVLSQYTGHAVYESASGPDQPGKVLSEEESDATERWYMVVDFRTGHSWKVRKWDEDSLAFAWSPSGRYLYMFWCQYDMAEGSAQLRVQRHDLQLRSTTNVPLPPSIAGVPYSRAQPTYVDSAPSFPIGLFTWNVPHGPSWVAVPSGDDGLLWLPWSERPELFHSEWKQDRRGFFVCVPYGRSEGITADAVEKRLVPVPIEAIPWSRNPRFDGFSLQGKASRLHTAGGSRALGSLWIEAEGEEGADKALVATEAVQFRADPRWSWIAYAIRGGLYVRNIQVVDREYIVERREAIERTKAVIRAKEVGTALHLYAADYDGAMPSAESLRSALEPYLLSSEMLDGFVFTLGERDWNSIQFPSETEVGYIPVKGGRAVVFADGHAKILPNPG